ncbi:MAG: COG4315 family predicted lipoprotein [Pseudobdellovibrionaceae bacterium]
MKMSFALLALSLTLASTTAWSAPTLPTENKLVQNLVNDENETLLTDNTGKTLYVFDLDPGKPVPACNGDCAEVWPPYLITDEEAKALAAPLGSITRKNGKLQLTFKGSPIYTYIFDRHQADDLGDGIGGVWHSIQIEAGL